MKMFYYGVITTLLSLIIIGGTGFIGYSLFFGGHNAHTNIDIPKSTVQAPSNNITADSTHNIHDSSTATNKDYNLNINNEPSSPILNDDAFTIHTPPMKKEPELTDVAFIDYIVNPADTLWRISKTYMPDFTALDTDETIGIITYIAERNKLKKGIDGEYKIYYGQKLNIPAQLSIVSKIVRSSNKNSTNTNKTIDKSNNSTIVKTPDNDESVPASHQENSSHSSH